MGDVWLEYRVDSGLVVNAIVYEEGAPYLPPEGLALVERGDSGAWIGWIYSGGEFLPPAEEE